MIENVPIGRTKRSMQIRIEGKIQQEPFKDRNGLFNVLFGRSKFFDRTNNQTWEKNYILHTNSKANC